jgi:cyanophycinase-like exopeptidase
MSGLIALLGSGEYLDVMDEVDRRLLAGARNSPPRVACLPTAAGQEGPASVNRWSKMGVQHFERLGARADQVLIVDRASADDPHWAEMIMAADLIYFSGGDPGFLYRTLVDTRAWQSVTSACEQGATLAGCSAGAMILGQYMPSRAALSFELVSSFGWIAHSMVLPHFDRLPFSTVLLPMVRRKLSDGQYALGIDENTALVGCVGGEWEVMGASKVSILTRHDTRKYPASTRIVLPGE